MFYHHQQHNHYHHYHYFTVKFFNPYYYYYYYYYYYIYQYDYLFCFVCLLVCLFFFFSRNASDPAVSFQKLILHCITAIDKSPKSFEIITTKNETDNRVDSHICVSHIVGHKKAKSYRKTKMELSSVLKRRITP